MIPITFYSPVIIGYPERWSSTALIDRVPGAIVILGAYWNCSLQTLVSINRLVAIGFRNWAPLIFRCVCNVKLGLFSNGVIS